MKKHYYLSFLLLICLSVHAQTYEKIYVPNAGYQITDGLVAGATNNGTALVLNGNLNITDSLGNILTSTRLGFTPTRMLWTTDGGYVFSMQTTNTSVPYAKLIKCDSLGNLVWSQQLSPDTVSSSIGIIRLDAMGNIYISADSVIGTNSYAYLLRKYDMNGNMLWSESIDRNTASFNVTASGDILLLGSSSINQNINFVQQLNTNGSFVSQYNYQHIQYQFQYITPLDIISLPSGGFVTLMKRLNSGYTELALFKMDANGTLLDSMALPGIFSYRGTSRICISYDGSLAFFGTLSDSNGSNTYPTLIDISTFGQINWQRYFPDGSGSIVSDIAPLPTGFVISGDSAYRSIHNKYVAKLDLNGLFNSQPQIDSAFYFNSDFTIIDTNNIAAGFNTDGNLFYQDPTGNSQFGNQFFRVPKSGLAHAIFFGKVWLAGKSNGSLYNSSEQYSSYLQSGPFDASVPDITKWNKIWSIKREEVLSVKNDFDLNHAITLPIPVSVLQWPAKGNPNAKGRLGAALNVTEDMAPFVDRNGDGVYNVYDGDYPLIKGDKMLWWINNDHGSLSQNPMNVDRRYSVYQFTSSTDSNLNNTLFLSVCFKNKSNRVYDSVRIGSFIDFDLGCANNDRIGCIPAKNTFFVYNGYVQSGTQMNGITCDEGVVCPVGEVGYGCALPIMTATYLNDSMKSFVYNANGSSSAQTDPYSDLDYYQYMNGQWRDGSSFTYGGNGYGGTTPYPFVYPGNPADANQWSECNSQTATPIASGDRRCYSGIGPFHLGAGDTISFDMAFIFHPGAYTNCPDLSDSSDVAQHIDSILQYYQSERFPAWYDSSKALSPAFSNVGINELALTPSFGLIPNPNNGTFSIHVTNPGIAEYSITVTDMIGRVLYYAPSVHSSDRSISLADASAGVYSVTLESQNYRASKRIVVTR